MVTWLFYTETYLLLRVGFGGGVGGRRLSSKLGFRVSTRSYVEFMIDVVDTVGMAGKGLFVYLPEFREVW